jgi:hypothetical protein
VEDRPCQTQNRGIPEQEVTEAEEGDTDQAGVTSYQEQGEGQEDATPVTQHATADEEIGDTGSNNLARTQLNEGEKCVLM